MIAYRLLEPQQPPRLQDVPSVRRRLQSYYSYEDTQEMNTLIVGNVISGFSVFV